MLKFYIKIGRFMGIHKSWSDQASNTLRLGLLRWYWIKYSEISIIYSIIRAVKIEISLVIKISRNACWISRWKLITMAWLWVLRDLGYAWFDWYDTLTARRRDCPYFIIDWGEEKKEKIRVGERRE